MTFSRRTLKRNVIKTQMQRLQEGCVQQKKSNIECFG